MSVQKNIILQRFVEMSPAESELGLAKQLELAKFQVLLLSSFYLVDVPFVFVFVFVHLLVMSCVLVTLKKCLKGH